MAPIQKRLAVDALQERWLRLVCEYRTRRRDSQQDGASAEELSKLDLSYAVRIDAAYGELKSAESLENLRSGLWPRRLI